MFAAARAPLRRVAAAARQASQSAARQMSAVRAAPASRSVAFGAAALATTALAGFAYTTSTNAPVEAAASTIPIAGVKGTTTERTFIAVKPDGVQRGLVGEVISRFERRGYKLVGLKLVVPSKALVEQHYGDLKGRPFFNGLVEYMSNGKAPVVGMVWQGKDVIRQGRKLLGATNPLDSEPGTLRADYCTAVGRNCFHGSDSHESATTEISLWFGEKAVFDWKQALEPWIASDN
ncbi:hypothetical protein GGF32_006067 [Allomyces javanicus]|nr:hypothetical protein GGF32_006067 [Allomyces javanicus]